MTRLLRYTGYQNFKKIPINYLLLGMVKIHISDEVLNKSKSKDFLSM